MKVKIAMPWQDMGSYSVRRDMKDYWVALIRGKAYVISGDPSTHTDGNRDMVDIALKEAGWFLL